MEDSCFRPIQLTNASKLLPRVTNPTKSTKNPIHRYKGRFLSVELWNGTQESTVLIERVKILTLVGS